MAYHHFTACRVTGNGNALFPDEIIIKDDCVVYRKGQLMGYKETRIRFGSIGCVSVKAGVMFADVIIETNGGLQIRAKGFSRGDASSIARLLG